MVLTPDQKKRIAALDSGPAQPEEDEPTPVGAFSVWLKGLGLQAKPSQISSVLFKILIVLVMVAIAAYLIILNDLHNIDFREVFKSGGGGPISKFATAIKQQKEKTKLWEKGQGYLLEGEYEKVIEIASEIQNLDPKDPRRQGLIDDTVIAVTHKASREFESGEIEDALQSVRFALKHESDYGPANDLIMEISDRLLVEAQAHSAKKEYAQLIIKAKEVLDINGNNMAAFNLLLETNNELLDSADEYYLLRQYTKALEKVMLALAIDDKDPRTISTFENIRKKVATPTLEVHGIYTIGGETRAKIKVRGKKRPEWVKKGQTIENYKVVDIDPAETQVRLRQVHTGEKITLYQIKKPD